MWPVFDHDRNNRKVGIRDNWLNKRIDDRPAQQGKCLGMGALIDTAVDKVGRIINDLRPSILDHQ
jgi:hypothetical protein